MSHGNTTHGMRYTRVYSQWRGMLTRCYNTRSNRYYRYGGRGITVCTRWHTFENFLIDMGEAPSGYTLDRKNNDKPYSKRNCKWSSGIEQQQNTSRTVKLTYNGVTKTQTAWAEELGLHDSVIHRRLKRGWSVSKTLSRLSVGQV